MQKFWQVLPELGVKQGVGQISHFLHLYFSKVARDTSKWLIRSHIYAFDWHPGRWPWMTLSCYSSNFWRISRCSTGRRLGRQKRLNERNLGTGNGENIQQKLMSWAKQESTNKTRSQAVARIADRTASQHLWVSRDVIGRSLNHLIPHMSFPIGGSLEPILSL